MGLKEVLQEHKVPIPEDFDQRFDIVIAGLKRSPEYEQKLNAYKTQTAGAVDPNDFLTPNLQWFIKTMTTPAAQNVLRVLFAVLFFVSYLENIPVFGSILSVGLDVMTAGIKSFMKAIQKAVPALFGLIPLPFMSLVGMGIAAVFGLIVWPIVSMVSFSRQDFTASVDSIIRVIPPPIGDAIADTFLEVNRTVGRLNAKRKKIADDISKGFQAISQAATGVSTQVKQGAEVISKKTKEVAESAGEKVQDAALSTALKFETLKASPGLSQMKDTARAGITSAKDTISAQVPTGIMNKLGDAGDAAKKVSEVFPPSVPASQIIKDADPLKLMSGKGRKKLSRKPHMKGKWKTRRNKYARR